VGWPRLHSIAHQHAMCLSTRVASVRRVEAAPHKGCRCLCSPSFREVAFFLGGPETTLQGKRGGSKAVSGTATVRRGRCKPVYPNFRAATFAARDVLQVADDLHLGVPRDTSGTPVVGEGGLGEVGRRTGTEVQGGVLELGTGRDLVLLLVRVPFGLFVSESIKQYRQAATNPTGPVVSHRNARSRSAM
jgi:hypothetical protein